MFERAAIGSTLPHREGAGATNTAGWCLPRLHLSSPRLDCAVSTQMKVDDELLPAVPPPHLVERRIGSGPDRGVLCVRLGFALRLGGHAAAAILDRGAIDDVGSAPQVPCVRLCKGPRRCHALGTARWVGFQAQPGPCARGGGGINAQHPHINVSRWLATPAARSFCRPTSRAKAKKHARVAINPAQHPHFFAWPCPLALRPLVRHHDGPWLGMFAVRWHRQRCYAIPQFSNGTPDTANAPGRHTRRWSARRAGP